MSWVFMIDIAWHLLYHFSSPLEILVLVKNMHSFYILEYIGTFWELNRPGEAGTVLQTPSLLIS